MYIKCGLTVACMLACINKKFGVKVRYQDVYSMVKAIKKVQDDKSNIKEAENEFE